MIFNQLRKHVEYRIQLIDAGGTVNDVIQLYNTLMLVEVDRIPFVFPL